MRARPAESQRKRLDTRARILHVLSVSTPSQAWTPGRIASVSVLALAVGALVIDKAFLGQSDPSSAAAAQAAPVVATEKAARHSVVESLAHRLEQHRQESTVPAGRAFIAPEGFFPEAAPVVTQSDAGQASTANASALVWPRLSAVVTGSSPGAILDGRLMRVGESLGAVELISVSERSVMVRQGEQVMSLTLDETHR